MNIFTKIYIFLTVLISSSFAQAVNTALTAPTFDLTNVVTVGGALLAALAGIWAIKRAIGFVRS